MSINLHLMCNTYQSNTKQDFIRNDSKNKFNIGVPWHIWLTMNLTSKQTAPKLKINCGMLKNNLSPGCVAF